MKKWRLLLSILLVFFCIFLAFWVWASEKYKMETSKDNAHSIYDKYYSFNPDMVLSQDGIPSQFQEIEKPDMEPELQPSGEKIDWTQEQYIAVAEKVLALQTNINQEIYLSEMSFGMSYSDYEVGPQEADFRYTKSIFYERRFGVTANLWHVWDIKVIPAQGYVRVFYSQYYPISRPTYPIDLASLKVSVEQAIKIAGEIEGYANKGYGETPTIYAGLSPGAHEEWYIYFDGSNFIAHIDTITGEVIKVINP